MRRPWTLRVMAIVVVLLGAAASASYGASGPARKVWAGVGMIYAPAPPAAEAPARIEPPADVAGRWVGVWSVPTPDGVRSGPAVAELSQAGAMGSGTLSLDEANAAPAVPAALRRAGVVGVPVRIVVSGTRITVEHELGGDLLTADLEVAGDRLRGSFRSAEGRVRLALSRVPGLAPAEVASRPVAPAAREDFWAAEGAAELAAVRSVAEKASSEAESARALAGEADATAKEAAAAARADARPVAEAGPARAVVVGRETIMFGFGQWTVDDAGRTTLGRVVKRLREDPELTVNLEGYADPVGTAAYNVHLSQRRATVVLRYFLDEGVDLARIRWAGLGALSGTGTAREQAEKRRVTVTLESVRPPATVAGSPPQ